MMHTLNYRCWLV